MPVAPETLRSTPHYEAPASSSSQKLELMTAEKESLTEYLAVETQARDDRCGLDVYERLVTNVCPS